MLVHRVVIVIIVLTLVSAACGNTNLEPAPEPRDTQSNPPPTSKPAVQAEAAGFPGCESLPGDVPFLEDAFEAGDYQGWCSYKTDHDYQAAVDFYRTGLSSNGWEEFRTTESDRSGTRQTNFYFEKSGRKVAVGIIYTVGIVIVTIYPDHWIDQPCDHGDTGLPTPEDVPIIGNMIASCREEYPWSDTGEGYYFYEYTTLESFDEVVEYYREEAIQAGWTFEDEYAQDMIIKLDFKKPGRMGTVQAGMDNFIEVPLDTMSVQIMGLEEYGDTNVKIAIDDGP